MIVRCETIITGTEINTIRTKTLNDTFNRNDSHAQFHQAMKTYGARFVARKTRTRSLETSYSVSFYRALSISSFYCPTMENTALNDVVA